MVELDEVYFEFLDEEFDDFDEFVFEVKMDVVMVMMLVFVLMLEVLL